MPPRAGGEDSAVDRRFEPAALVNVSQGRSSKDQLEEQDDQDQADDHQDGDKT
jgi:hypothetical protein